MTDPHDLTDLLSDSPDSEPQGRDVDGDLSCWDEHDDPEPPSEVLGDHPLGEQLAIVADVCEALQTWASDLAADLRKRGGRPTDAEVEEGKELASRAQEAVVVLSYLSRHM